MAPLITSCMFFVFFSTPKVRQRVNTHVKELFLSALYLLHFFSVPLNCWCFFTFVSCALTFFFSICFFSLALYPHSFLVFCLALLFLFSSMPSPLSFLLLSPPLSSGQLISDDVSEIFTRFTNDYFTRYGNTLSTKSANAQYDDSYLGNYTITYTPSVRFS